MKKIWKGCCVDSKMKFEILEEWDALLDMFSNEQKDIYFTKKYVEMYEKEDRVALCVVCTEGANVMLMPYLRGRIGDYYDHETAYGYGGPIANTDDIDWCKVAFIGIHEYLRKENYICGFIRFHPLLRNERFGEKLQDFYDHTDKCSPNSMEVIYDRQTVIIDTSRSVEDIWRDQISSKNRNMIRKAEKNHLEYRSEYDFASYDEFIDLYRSTMLRLSADKFYFFDDKFFVNLKKSLAGQSFLGTVRKDGKLVCAGIFMYSELYGHYHLAGSSQNYSGLGGNNYMLWKAACEMHELGVKEFHLGGGTSSSPDDSLYRFKKAFGTEERRFYIGKEIFNWFVYDNICRDWEKRNIDKKKIYGNRLLKYRY